MNLAKRTEIFRRLRAANPAPTTELDYANPFQLLIAVILSAQATDKSGRKTANVVLNTAFGEATIAVDTHIFRVANRTKLAPGNTPLAVELKLLKAVPEEFKKDAHHWLILHGRYICKARKPECWNCAITDLCAYRDKYFGP